MSGRKNSSKVPWLPFVGSAVVVPLALTAVATATPLGKRGDIERDLSQRSVAALHKAGLPHAKVSFDGRDATVTGVAANQKAKAADAVEGVDGVRTADVKVRPKQPSKTNAPATPAQPLQIKTDDKSINLSGGVPDAKTKSDVVAAANKNAAGRKVTDNLTINKTAKTSGNDAKNLVESATKIPGDVSVADDGSTITLTGTAKSQKAKRQAGEDVKRQGRTVDNELKVAKAPQSKGKGVDRSKLQGQINQILSGSPITFGSDSSDLTSDGTNTIAQVAGLLKGNKAKIRVEGNVAAVPGGDPSTDQQLSEARANAVAQALSGDGVDSSRITTRGYGSSKPVADNNTPEGQAANRRVDIVVL